jgi:hypothetical protein
MENEKEWANLTPLEKREKRYEWWMSADINFSSPKARKNYRERALRFVTAYSVETPDRVPVVLPVDAWPAYLAGTDLITVINDYDKARQAWSEFYDNFEMDIAVSPGMALPAKVYSLLDYKLYSWPGHGLPPNASSIQFVEGEYMREDEYNLLIHNPSDFWMRTYIPRVFGAFESWKYLNSFTSIIEMPAAWFMPYTRPDLQAAAQRLIDIGKELAVWLKMTGEFDQWAQESGYPLRRMLFLQSSV